MVLLAYVPLSSFQSTLLNDDIDVALSTKYFAGECFQHGFLPLWNPYQIWGFPAHADLQYTNWNLETLLTGILSGYDYVTFHILFILYLFLAAVGAFLLARHLSKNDKAAFYIACVYVLSGLVIAHVQSLVTILGLVWLPYVVLYFFKWLNEASIKNTITLCIFSYLLMTLGYQAFVFMLIPPFVILFIHRLIVEYKAKERATLKQRVISGLLALALLFVLMLPVLITQFQAKPFVARLNGMSVQEVMMNPFSPLSMVSFINPMLTIGHDDWFATELTMRNAFIGLIPLALIFISLFKKQKTAIDLILISVAAVYLLGSFGDVIPVRKLMYYILPGFKLFRFPSLLRVVAMLLMLCYWASNFNWSLTFFYEQKKKRNGLLLVLLGLSVTCALACFIKAEEFTFWKNAGQGFNQRIVQANPLEIAFYVSLLQSVILALAYVLFNRSQTIEKFSKKLVILTVSELIMVVWIYGQFTTFTNLKPKDFQQNFAKMQKGFPLPSKDALSDTKYKFDHLEHFWKNTGAFKKQLVNDDAWTSFYFSNYDKLTAALPELKDSLLSYPLVYLSQPLEQEQLAAIPVDTTKRFIKASFHYRGAEASMQYTAFSPQEISINIKTKDALTLNLQQSYYTGWKVKVDGIEQPILWNAGLLMSVAVPKGLHAVSFVYSNPVFEKSIAVSYILFVLLVLGYIILMPISKAKKQAGLLLFLGFSLAVCAVFFKHSEKKQVAVTNGFTVDYSNSTRYYDFNSKEDIAAAIAALKNNKPKNIRYSWTNYYNSPELFYALGIDPGALSKEQQAMNGQIAYRSKDHASTLQKINFDSTYVDQAFIDTSSVNGYSLLLNEQQNPYSKLIPIDDDKLNGRNLYGFVTLKAERFSNPMIVCNMKHADGTEESLYSNLNKYLLPTNDWQNIPYYFDLKEKLKAKDKVSLFLINVTKHKVFVKKLTVECFEQLSQ